MGGRSQICLLDNYSPHRHSQVATTEPYWGLQVQRGHENMQMVLGKDVWLDTAWWRRKPEAGYDPGLVQTATGSW